MVKPILVKADIYSEDEPAVPRVCARKVFVVKPVTHVKSEASSVAKKRKRNELSHNASRKQRGYAPPDAYAHLEPLPDHTKDELDVLFCGINPGCRSAKDGHHYAHPTNHFWSCLHLSGFTERRLHPSEDQTLPDAYNLGLTNLVDRPSSEQAELSKEEMSAASPKLLIKIAACRPRISCFVGKDIWLHVERALLSCAPASQPGPSCTPTNDQDSKKRPSGPKGTRSRQLASAFSWDIQPYKLVYDEQIAGAVKETLFFVMPSTSARVARYQMENKAEIFTVLRRRLDQLKQMELDTSAMLPVLAEAISL